MQFFVKIWLGILCLIFASEKASTQQPEFIFKNHISAWADSLRIAHKMPALAYALVTADSVITLEVLGKNRMGAAREVNKEDRFRIGSNTKAVTACIAAKLVQEGKLQWNSRFFDYFPELKAKSHRAYHQLTLLELLSFRTRLYAYTYTDSLPRPEDLPTDVAAARKAFMAWVLAQNPITQKKKIHFSNPGYVAAGLMMEKASGKSYQELVQELNLELGLNFAFGAPNEQDSTQIWGHDKQMQEEAPIHNPKLDWLLCAGNLNSNLPDYAKFIQFHLKGLSGRSTFLPKSTFEFLHFGLPEFALGWNWYLNEEGKHISYHKGNPGTFLSKVFVHADDGKAYILLTNVQSPAAEAALDLLYQKLQSSYK